MLDEIKRHVIVLSGGWKALVIMEEIMILHCIAVIRKIVHLVAINFQRESFFLSRLTFNAICTSSQLLPVSRLTFSSFCTASRLIHRRSYSEGKSTTIKWLPSKVKVEVYLDVL